MTIHKSINFSKGRLAKLDSMTIANGDTFEDCNFVQIDPHTEVLAGYTGLTFTGCNLMNCDLPGDAVVIGKPPRHRSFCTHLHPTKVGVAGECAENCSHVSDSDSITIDSVAVATIYHYTDTGVV